MFQTGFDSSSLAKKFERLDGFLDSPYETEAEESEPTVLKALVGASVTTEVKNFDHYQAALKEALERYHIRREKGLYKGAHLVKQAGEKADVIVTDLLNNLESIISHIDLYFATYDKPYISIYGKAQGEL